jgi:hypothetical protein
VDSQDWFNVLAVAGAANWLVPFLAKLARPNVRIVPAGNVEIGFTSYGPILNLTAALKTSRRDALVTGMSAILRHENRQETRFTCTAVQEQTGAAQAEGSPAVLYHRNSSTVVIGLSMRSVVEKKFFCTSEHHLQGYSPLAEKVDQLRSRLIVSSPDSWLPQVKMSAEYEAVSSFIRNEFIWTPGRYSCVAMLRVEELRDPVELSFGFSLSQFDVDNLRLNIGMLDSEFEQMLEKGSPTKTSWRWTYPRLQQGI